MDKNFFHVSDNFLEAEYREGYYVSEKMKKIWAVELDLLEVFIHVCEKNNLNYFMDGGTLLGAVRHKGFIPWDDDADVIMPREDYNRLFEIAEKEFKHPYFFQTTLSEDGFFRTHAQLRNSETTGFIKIDEKKDINKGIFIDIFVLDGIPDYQWQQWMLEKQIGIEKRFLAFQYDRDFFELSIKGKLFYIFVHIFFIIYPFKKLFQHFNLKVLGRYSNKNTRFVGDITLEWRENVQWPRDWFDGYVYLPFEHLQLRAPLFYKEVLRKQYGDFMKFPEDINAANGKTHGQITFDQEVSYKEYCGLVMNTGKSKIFNNLKRTLIK